VEIGNFTQWIFQNDSNTDDYDYNSSKQASTEDDSHTSEQVDFVNFDFDLNEEEIRVFEAELAVTADQLFGKLRVSG
jgi:hypothetical protein